MPQAKAGPSFKLTISKGKFQGVIAPTIPTGSRRVYTKKGPSANYIINLKNDIYYFNSLKPLRVNNINFLQSTAQSNTEDEKKKDQLVKVVLIIFYSTNSPIYIKENVQRRVWKICMLILGF